jgi:hypothetical protein
VCVKTTTLLGVCRGFRKVFCTYPDAGTTEQMKLLREAEGEKSRALQDSVKDG